MTLPYGRNSCNSTELTPGFHHRLEESAQQQKTVGHESQENAFWRNPTKLCKISHQTGKKWIKSSSLKKRCLGMKNGFLWFSGGQGLREKVSAKAPKAWAAGGYGSAWHTIPRHWHSAGRRPRETRPPACQQKVKAWNATIWSFWGLCLIEAFLYFIDR